MDKRRFSFGGLCVAALFAVLLAHCAAVAEEPDEQVEQADEPQFTPGEETRIEDPKSGELGYYLVYVPKGYTPDHNWPIIFCYHGLGGKPTTSPFKHILGGRHYIIAGMGYHMRSKKGYDYLENQDVKIFKRVLLSLGKRLKVNKDRLFVGGFSKGAFYASGMINELPKVFAGALMLGGGKHGSTRYPKAFKGKPIFIGCGEKDTHLKYAKDGIAYYGFMKARLTYEKWPDLGHQCNTESKMLIDWLLYNGPLANAKSELASAGKLVKNNKPGRAYAIYARLADVSDTDKTCIAAAKAAKQLAQEAAKQLAQAEKAVDEKRYAQATRALAKTAAAYAGSDFGKQAEQKLQMLQADPQIKEIIKLAEINAKADALQARAAAAEKEKKYAKAIKLYEQYVAAYPQADRYKQVKAHLEAMKADKDIQNSICSKNADRDCRKWLMMADNYISAGMAEKAKPYLKR
ncbi:MAG: hypothetical protein SVT52_04960, partial [Planctomycetota bacterium]|nr:hypothetical protein [Planctomycetota bacterium]